MQLEVFGEPVTELEIKRCEKNIDTFFADHSEKVREVLDEASKYGGVAAFDMAIIGSRSLSNDKQTRADLAWQALAWERLVNAYTHEARGYYQKLDGLIESVHEHHVALYKYALFVVKEPNEELYKALRFLSQRAAKQYREYAVWVAVARAMGRERDLEHLWS